MPARTVILTIWRGTAALAVLLWVSQAAAAVVTNEAHARLETFQHDVDRLQRDASQATPAEMESLLAQSFDLGRPQAAAALVKSYLRRHRDSSLSLLLKSAQVAEWSGDLRSAVDRYKRALQIATNAPSAPDTMLRLFRLQVADLDDGDDAFRLMTELGEAARTTPALKRFDGWYLNQAMARKDTRSIIRRMALILSDRMPLELERQAYWDVLDVLMRDLAAVRPELVAVLPECRYICENGLIRRNEAWSKRFDFLTANLAFAVNTAGQDAATQAREFDAVARAARAYIQAAPTADTLREIACAFGGGWNRFDPAQMTRCAEAKSAVFTYAFDKLDPAQRDVFFLANTANWQASAWIPRLNSPEQYARLVAANPDYFRQSAAIDCLPLLGNRTNAVDYKALSPALRGMPNADALVIVALGSSDELEVCWQRVIQDSWFLKSFDEISRALDRVRLHYRGSPRPAGRSAEEQFGRALARFGAVTLSRTPQILFDIPLARAYVLAAWQYNGSGDLDKSKVAAAWHALDWVPYTQKERADIFGPACVAVRAWTNGVQQQLQAALRAEDGTTRDLAAAVSLFAPLEELCRQVQDASISDRSRAPDDFCYQLSRAKVAVREHNQRDFLDAARTLYPLVRDDTVKQTPYGRATLCYLLTNRLEAFDTLDFQCEVVADQLTRGTPKQGNRLPEEVMNLLGEKRIWIREQALKLNAVLARGVRDQLARNQFDATVFEWFLNTRRGKGWSESERDQDIMELLIQQPELLASQPDRTVYLMNGIWSHFPKLADKYPLGTWFEDAFADECRKRNFVDRNYYLIGGRDAKGAALQAMAEVFASYDRLPFGYDGGKPIWSDRASFWEFHNKAMGAPPATRDAMLTQIESCFGRTRFDYYANGSARLATLSLGNREERKRYFDLLNAWIDAREREPVPVLSASIEPVIQAYNERAHPERRELAPAELDTLLRLFPLAPQWNWQESCQLDRILLDAMFAAKRYNEMFSLAPHLWGLARATPVEGDNMCARMVETTVKLADAGKLDLAATYAAAGLLIMGNRLQYNQRTTLMAIKSKALSGVCIGPVIPRSDRRFPLFQAQANFQIGRTEDAWEACLAHHDLFPDCYREIDPDFSIWLINKLTEVGNYGDAEKYIGMMIQWVDQSPQSFAPADRVSLLLAFANIPFQRQEYPKAKAICEQILANKDFADVPERYDADLKIVEIDRLCKKYDAAIERLQKLLQRNKSCVQSEANYQMALASMGQAGYPDVNVREKQTTANLPAQTAEPLPQAKSNTVPNVRAAPAVRPSLRGSRAGAIGKPIRFTLQDKNLTVVGRASVIEIRIWAASGDEETFALLPVGDTKYKFEGSIPTALAPMQKHDKVLQVLGGDTVYFDYSEAFKKANKIVGDPPAGIRMVSDSELYVSSNEMVSKAERAQQEKDRMIRERLQRIAVEAGQVTTGSVSTIRTGEEVKPGAPINVRVMDPGASITTNRNKLFVRAVASSGDRITRVELLETAPYSGVYEGSIPTAWAAATAMAMDSEEGREPGFAITTADYPAWQAMPDNRPPKWLGVDLNGRHTLGQMKIDADVTGRHLRRFLVQNSLNGRDFKSVGAWPENLPAWSGVLRLEVARYWPNWPAGYSLFGDSLGVLRNYKEFLDIGYIAAECQKAVLSPGKFEVDWAPGLNLGGLADRLQIETEGSGSWFIGRMQGAFYQPVLQKLAFRVAGPDLEKPPANCFFVLDDDIAGGSKMLNGEAVARSVSNGMHKAEIYFVGMRKNGLHCWLEKADVGNGLSFAPCASEMFAPPANLPPRELAQAIQSVAFTPAVITNAPDNRSFTVTFAPDTQARVIRLWLLDYEGDAPAIQKLHLTAGDGRKLLPLAEDVIKRCENGQLEILPGDQIVISYENQHATTKARQFNEASLRVVE